MKNIDKTNAVLAGLVFIVSFIIYAMTVQRTIPFWDCGEFIASSYILGIPHPPGTPLFVLLGRLFSIIPFVEDISQRVNYMSVVSSAFTAMFSYLLIVKIVGYFFNDDDNGLPRRFIAYVGGLAGAFFVAFSSTNWGNAVEAEVYGLSLAMMVGMLLLTLRYFELRGTARAVRLMVFVVYAALLGIGIHMTVFLVLPICAMFFVLKPEADTRDWAIVCSWFIVELLFIILLSNGRGGSGAFYLITAVLGGVVAVMLYKKINWATLIAIGALSIIMVEFSIFKFVAPAGILVLLILAAISKKYDWEFRWRSGVVILLLGIVGFSVHMYIPIRSALNPRIDENHPARDFRTFENYLDRKQYGQTKMTTRMFDRRGEWKNQLGRHPHMGFWSYFEEQYSEGYWAFIPFFILGMIGLIVAIRKRLEIGLPFFTLFLIASVGLVLYMNFADGTQYSARTGDAYLEVRNRDYFFTPAFVFFGIAMGLGVSAVMQWVAVKVGAARPDLKKTLVYAMSVLVLLPGFSLAKNYHINDRSGNVLPLAYAKNILDTCEKDAILFTTGDNDTFPVWCLQEAYNYRKDVRVVNLSLLNTDWYVAQMKNFYDVPISLTDEQILWHPYEFRPGVWGSRPLKMFKDRPRGVQTYMQAYMLENKTVRVQDMIVDEVVIENRWKVPIYFSTLPYAESPLKLRDRAVAVGVLYRLDREPAEGKLDIDRSYELFTKTYQFTGLESPDVYRDDNATGVFLSMGSRAVQLHNALMAQGDTARANEVIGRLRTEYPEFLNGHLVIADLQMKQGDTVGAIGTMQQSETLLEEFLASNESNLYYMQDLGAIKIELGRRTAKPELVEEGIQMMWDAFEANANDGYGFHRLVIALSQEGRYEEIGQAARIHAKYKRNLEDPYVQQILAQFGYGTGMP